MSRRLKIIVAYDGAPFAGWQSQSHGNTIQDHLEQAFKRVSGEPVRVQGAGRTDAGVHALAQCAHADLAEGRLPAPRWTEALNAFLPPAIRILRCRYVSQNFHAHLCAKGKTYRYRICLASVLPPFEYGRAWHVPHSLDLKLLKGAASQFVGTHDFTAFAANRGKPEKSTVRTIYSVAVHRRGPFVMIEFDGDGFLYKMIRLIVGSLVHCALGKSYIEELTERLVSAHASHQRFVAPAQGLFLVRVRY